MAKSHLLQWLLLLPTLCCPGAGESPASLTEASPPLTKSALCPEQPQSAHNPEFKDELAEAQKGLGAHPRSQLVEIEAGGLRAA